jgi:hypothetical protein
MPSTVSLIIQATVRGFVFGSSGVPGSSVSAQAYHTTFSSTYSGFLDRQTVIQVTTAQATATRLAAAGSSNSGLLLIPAATYTGYYNVTASTAQVGIQLQGPSPAIVPTSAASFIYTTNSRSFPIQVVQI